MNIKALSLGLTLASAAVSSGHATEILFTVTGGDPTTTFELPAMPTPDGFNLDFGFNFDSVPAVYGGSAIILSDLIFYNSFLSGGFQDDNFFDLQGWQLYSGPESSPTFTPGVYTGMYNVYDGATDTVTLTAVPEVSTWAMLLAGFAGLGFAAYRRTRGRAISLID